VNNALALTLDGTAVGGFESLEKLSAGTLTLTGDHAYATGTTISAGTLRIGNGGPSGTLASDVLNNGTLAFDRADTYQFAGLISGSGAVTQAGTGTTILSGTNTYAGPTTVQAGTLLINGDQSGAIGPTTVQGGGTLGGEGIIGGDGTVADGGALSPGAADGAAGLLTINGNLELLGGTSALNLSFGEANVAGGLLNDLIRVNGDLTLGGVLNVTETDGGSFGPGVYRVIEYTGALAGTLTPGTMPPGSQASLQTSTPNRVNLINTAGLTLNYWDGDAGPKNNGVVDGGNGTWRAGGDDNWTDGDGQTNGSYANGSFAIFQGTPGTVTVDGAGVNAAGMQFAVDGYSIQGGPITLAGPQAIIRVGLGSVGADYVATIGSPLGGGSQLVKANLGTLVLTGTNTYTGGTRIEGGTLRVSADGNLGQADGALTFDGGTLHTTATLTAARAATLEDGGGAFVTDTSTTLTLTGAVDGAGSLIKAGAGTLVLAADNSYGGGTTISAGTLQIGDGGATGTVAGDIANNGALVFNRSGALAYAGAITGTGSRLVDGGLSLTMTGDSSYGGDTTVLGGQLTLSGGGSIVGTAQAILANNSTLTVSGAGSELSAGSLQVGSNIGSTSAVTIDNSGVVRVSGNARFGASAAADAATLTISDAGSLLEVDGALEFAISTTAVLNANVTGGGQIRSNSTLIGTPFAVGGDKQVTLSGTGTAWTNATTLALRSGTLSVLDGAQLSTGSANITAGANPVALIVSGANSTFSNAGDLVVGGAGTGATVTLANGGRMSVGGQLSLADTAGGTAVLNIGGAEGQAAEGAGVLDAATLALGPGTARVNFNHTEADYTFATAMSGAGTISQRAGVTRLTGDSSAFTGPTTVSGSTLLVNNALGDAASTVGVLSGGTLGGTGIIGGDVTVADGGISPGDLGNAPDTLTINGSLTPGSASTLSYNFGEANVEGGPFNDLIKVGGDLDLDGTLNVTVTTGGSFDPGIYRVIGYAGALNNKGLDVSSPDYFVQT
jgi:fibronectin-binding autotransporter adhesin